MKMLKGVLPIVFMIVILLAVTYNGDAKKVKKKPTSTSTTTLAPSDDAAQELSEECLNIEKDVESKINSVLIIGYPKPNTVEEVEQYCKNGAGFVKYMKKYSQLCTSTFARQFVSLIVRGAKQLMKKICSTQQLKEEAALSFSCMTEDSLDRWNDCLQIVNRQFYYIAENTTNLIADCCCLYTTWPTCLDKAIVKVDSSKCDSLKSHPKVILKMFVDTLVKDVSDFACSKYPTKDACLKNNPYGMKMLEWHKDNIYDVPGPVILGSLIKMIAKLTEE